MKCWYILFCFFCLSPVAYATDTLIISPNSQQIYIGKHIQILDDNGRLSINDLLQSRPGFRDVQTDVPLFADKETYVWIRFTVRNQTAKDLWLGIENPVTDTILFYETKHNQIVSSGLSGDKVPFTNREVRSNRIFFRINYTPVAETIYLRLNIRLPRQFPITLATSTIFLEREITQLFMNGLFYGFILVIVIYNLFLWFVLHDRSYLYYILYMIFSGLLLMHFDGITYTYLWPSSPWLNDHPAIIASIPIFFACLFVSVFLNLKHHYPALQKGLWSICIFLVLSCMMSATGYKFSALALSQFVAFAGSFYFFFIGVMVYRKGYRPARYYLASWTVLIAGVLIFLAKDMGWIAYNIFTSNSLKIGIGAEAVLIAFALADRFSFYKAEKKRLENEKMQAEAEKIKIAGELENAERLLTSYTENLRQKNQLIEQFKGDFEQLELKLKGTELEKDQSETIDKLLQSIILTEENWTEFRKLFDKVYQGYIFRVRSKYAYLTESDIRLITLMKLKLSYREMANMLGVTTEAVRKARQRLRAKLELGLEDDIEGILNEV